MMLAYVSFEINKLYGKIGKITLGTDLIFLAFQTTFCDARVQSRSIAVCCVYRIKL